MDAITLLRKQLDVAHTLLEATMDGVGPAQAHWLPPGKANSLAASYAHLIIEEDDTINAVLRGRSPLCATIGADRMGVSETPLLISAGGKQALGWDGWARHVRVDLPVLRDYARAVYAASDEYLATLAVAELDRTLDLSEFGLGEQTVDWIVTEFVIGHVNQHCGEIACLKGLQGAKGYPI